MSDGSCEAKGFAGHVDVVSTYMIQLDFGIIQIKIRDDLVSTLCNLSHDAGLIIAAKSSNTAAVHKRTSSHAPISAQLWVHKPKRLQLRIECGVDQELMAVERICHIIPCISHSIERMFPGRPQQL